jgi:hypothetical protein
MILGALGRHILSQPAKRGGNEQTWEIRVGAVRARGVVRGVGRARAS